MKLEDLGYTDKLEKFKKEENLEEYESGRIIAEHKERYIVRTGDKELEAEITGNLRYTSESREDFPAVGDWVALSVYETDFAIIHKILPRFSLIKRQAAGGSGELQVIAANIDYAFIVQSADRDFNINRIERYLTICYASKVSPVIIVTKVHIKEYSTKLADTQGKRAGFNVKLTEGDVDWTAVMKALDQIGYNGWTTIEQPGGDTPEGLKDLRVRLDKIIQS